MITGIGFLTEDLQERWSFLSPHKRQSIQVQGAGGSDGERKERRLDSGPLLLPHSANLVFT